MGPQTTETSIFAAPMSRFRSEFGLELEHPYCIDKTAFHNGGHIDLPLAGTT